MATFTVPADARDPAYDKAILDAIARGDHVMPFAAVRSAANGHTGEFYLSADALKIDGVRWGMGAKLMQQAADLLGCMLPTAKLRDLLYVQRSVTLEPVTYSMVHWPQNDTSTALMRAVNKEIDARLVKAGSPGGIIQSINKPWILINRLLDHPGTGCNYGWYVPSSYGSSWLGVPVYPAETDPSLRLVQQPGFAHGLDQSDYSESATLVHRVCRIDGHDADLLEVMQDPAYAALVSHEGPLRLVRQPGVAVYACPMGVPVSADMSNCPTPPAPSNVEGRGKGTSLLGALAIGGLAAAAAVVTVKYVWPELRRTWSGTRRV